MPPFNYILHCVDKTNRGEINVWIALLSTWSSHAIYWILKRKKKRVRCPKQVRVAREVLVFHIAIACII